MTNYSRTTLRELKKRYLNILKKCLLANLMAFMVSVPVWASSTATKNDGSAAVTITDTSGNGAELLGYLKDSSYHVITDGTFSNIVVDENGESVTYIGVPKVDTNGNTTYTYQRVGGILKNSGNLTFSGGNLTFKDGNVYSDSPWNYTDGAAVYNSGTMTFNNQVVFLNNTAKTGSWNVRARGTVYNSGTMNFKEHVVFKDNYANGNAFVGEGASIYNTKIMNFTSADFIGNKSGLEDRINYAGSSSAIENTSSGTIKFTGITNFKNNEVWKHAGGNGMISNSGRIELLDDATFDQNKLMVIGGNEAFGAVLSNSGTLILGKLVTDKENEKVSKITFTNNTSSAGLNSYGGAISNSKTMTFNGETLFENNYSFGNEGFSLGAAVYNTGTLTFKENATFKNNRTITNNWTGYGGAIFNNSEGKITFEGEARFENNYAKGVIMGVGGAVAMEVKGSITFGDKSYFINNVSEGVESARAGAVSIGWQGGTITFKDTATFLNNTVKGPIGSTSGGAYFSENNNSFTTFTNGFYFEGNKEIEVKTKTDGSITETERLNDIYIGGGVIYLKGDNKEAQEYIGGGIRGGAGMGTIEKSSAGLFLLADTSDNTGYSGVFNQTAGKTVAKSETFFRGTNNILGGELETHGSEILYSAIVGGTGTLTHLAIGDNPIEIKGLSFKEEDLGLSMTFKNGHYQLNSDVANLSGNKLMFEGTELDVADGVKVSGTVVGKDLTVSKGATPVSFTNLEVAKDASLYIQNRKVQTEILSLNENALLKVDLNNLSDHGKMDIGSLQGAENGKLYLILTQGPDQEEGIYPVFNMDTNLSLMENKVFDIKDLDDGSYLIGKKESKDLEKDLGLTPAEAEVLEALLDGNDKENKPFSKIQEEILKSLQSETPTAFRYGRKGLKTLSGTDNKLYQSVSTSQFSQMHTLITQMLTNASSSIFERGIDSPRASVYTKGLYDRIHSLAGDGFRIRSKGLILGVQSQLKEDLTLGVGYAGTKSIAKEDWRRTEVDSNTGFISVQYQPNNWWVNAVVTYSRAEYDEEKQILSSSGTANYNVDSLASQIMTGYRMKAGDFIINPEIGARYISINQEGYTDSFGTTAQKTTSAYVTALAGVKVGADLGWIRPLVGVSVGYDIKTDDHSTLNTLANGGTFYSKGEALDRLSTTISAGFAADINENASLRFEYGGSYRKEYIEHSGMLRLEYKF
ncbi:MAG: autotransporter domain-containing protein [Alphaproteobacteria bacterium]|nr:autotransporter domain-containing protein [Alphaproteobacteria bacterium]